MSRSIKGARTRIPIARRMRSGSTVTSENTPSGVKMIAATIIGITCGHRTILIAGRVSCAEPITPAKTRIASASTGPNNTA